MNGRSQNETQRSPTERINLIISGAHGRLDTAGPIAYLVKGVRDGILAIWYTGVYCDDRVMGPAWFKGKVKTVLHSGGSLDVGEDVWPARYRAGSFL